MGPVKMMQFGHFDLLARGNEIKTKLVVKYQKKYEYRLQLSRNTGVLIETMA